MRNLLSMLVVVLLVATAALLAIEAAPPERLEPLASQLRLIFSV
jgi:hypothetical protein